MTITLNTVRQRRDRCSTDYLVIREYDHGDGSDVVRDPLLFTGRFGSRRANAKVKTYKTRAGAERVCPYLPKYVLYVPGVTPRYSVCTAVEWDQWVGTRDESTGAPVVAVYRDGSVDLPTGFPWDRLFSTALVSVETRTSDCQLFVDQEMPNPSESERKRAAYFMASTVRMHFDLDVDQFWPIFCSWNDRNSPPLSEVELRQSIMDHEQYLRNVAAVAELRQQLAALREKSRRESTPPDILQEMAMGIFESLMVPRPQRPDAREPSLASVKIIDSHQDDVALGADQEPQDEESKDGR